MIRRFVVAALVLSPFGGCTIDTTGYACDEEHPCRDDQMCVQGACVPTSELTSCTSDTDCPGEVCALGFCVPGHTGDDGGEPQPDVEPEPAPDGGDSDAGPGVCGDGAQGPTEACDESGDTATCDSDCTLVECGDSYVNEAAGEACDDGAGNGGTSCSADCELVWTCGDGVVTPGVELCDDGVNDGSYGSCAPDCQTAAPACGDGATDLAFGEGCDDGNTDDGDGCAGDCSQLDSCGNGTVEAGEDCDEPGGSPTCDPNCTLPVCGDATVNAMANEDCDDGAESAACDADCTIVECGDDLVNAAAGEECEEGGVPTADCDDDCTLAVCGDQTLNDLAGEECDDGTASPGCDDDCTFPSCGDSVLNAEAGEICDEGPSSPDCDDDCTPVLCGDGLANAAAGEECDGVGETPTCDADCTVPACGDGVTNTLAGEQCDDDGASATCDADCSLALCGDGQTNALASEQCDTAGPSATCDGDCTLAVCGDGVVNLGANEQCDTAGESPTCDADCTAVVCGDSVRNLAGGELCDEGGETSGCDSDCSSVVCGDGLRNGTAGEQCDDGNNMDDDGCSATCQAEEPVCGDSAVDPGEDCDEGQLTATCDSDCTVPVCGDGIHNQPAGEACDHGGPSATCDPDCTFAFCGDGTPNTAAGEQCDTAGPSTTCDGDCTAPQCGDGVTNTFAGEVCDTAGPSATCDGDCTAPLCGDGVTNMAAGEMCDTSGASASCDANCTPAQCGDGTLNTQAGELCDTAGPSATCDGDCTLPLCGDGVANIPAGEQCDTAGDSASCDANCTPATCGDSYVNAAANEVCDDGTNNGSYGGCAPGCAALGPRCGDGTTQAAQEACDDGPQNGQPGFCAANCAFGPPSVATSTITGSGPITANGVAGSTIIITLRDTASNAVVGIIPTFASTGTGNTLTQNCTATNGSGTSSCTTALRSTKAESKTLSIVTPISKSGGTVPFVAGPAAQANSAVVGTSPVLADGDKASTVTVTLRDAFNNTIAGVTPTLGALGTAVTVAQTCSVTNTSGVSTCSAAVRSTVEGEKTLRVTSPAVITGSAVTFVGLDTSARRGFQSRPCGFDMDRDGIVGGPLDCDVCDGVTTDPDRDGVNEDLIYVDTVAGVDNASNGSATNPVRTLAYALNTKADGVADGAEDIICLSGTVSNYQIALTAARSGLVSAYKRGDTSLPKNPFMIVGWDKNNNQQYPPYDTADTAVLQGSGTALRGFQFEGTASAASYVEIAHLTAVDFDRQEEGTAVYQSFYNLARGSGTVSHHHLHDLELRQIAEGSNDDGNDNVFAVVTWDAADISHITISNNLLSDAGGTAFAVAAWSALERTTDVTIENNDVTMTGTAGQDVTGLFTLGVNRGSFQRNSIDARPASWDAGDPWGILLAACSHDWVVQHNDVWNFETPIALDADWGSDDCTEQTVGNIIVDGNIVVTDEHYVENNDRHYVQMYVHAAHGHGQTIGNIGITNNIFYSPPGFQPYDAVRIEIGNDAEPQDSILAMVGNTIVGSLYGGVWIPPDSHPDASRLQDIYFLNNIITATNDDSVWVEYSPDRWVADANVYPPDQGFGWNNTYRSFANWKTATGGDGTARQCVPTFSAPVATAPTFPLAPADTCARGIGADILAFAFYDVEGDPRPATPHAAGANVDPDLVDLVLAESFNGPAGPSPGAGWVEVEDTGTGWEWERSYHALVHSGGGEGDPLIAQRSFPPRESGVLLWSFVALFESAPSDDDFAIHMQLGGLDEMDPGDLATGAAVSLRYGTPATGLATQGGFGAVEAGDDVIQLIELNGEIVFVEVVVNLEQQSYSVYLDGAEVEDVAFPATVAVIDTVRFVLEGTTGFELIESVRIEATP